jgi:hypothetical protein
MSKITDINDFYQGIRILPQKGDFVISPHENTVIIECPARENCKEKNLIGLSAYYSKDLIFIKHS